MIVAILREAAVTARSQGVASALTVLVVIGMVMAVMLTTGRTVGAELQVLSSIDSAGTRTIIVRADADAGVTSGVLDRIGNIEGIEWAAAFSGVTDGTNANVPDGQRVPVRSVFGDDFSRLGIPAGTPVPAEVVWASQFALEKLGMPDESGGVTLTSGASYAVAGALKVPGFLQSLEPAVWAPKTTRTGDEPVNLVVVLAESPDLVATVSRAVASVLFANDSTKLKIETSEVLAELRGLIQGQLGSFSRGLVLAILGVTGVLVAILLFGLVMMRRKDFGRRRALGASRGLIVGLVLTQTALLSVAGFVIGASAATFILLASGDPWPGGSFTAALGVLTLTTAIVAALIPAAVASTRDPIRELRVP